MTIENNKDVENKPAVTGDARRTDLKSTIGLGVGALCFGLLGCWIGSNFASEGLMMTLYAGGFIFGGVAGCYATRLFSGRSES